MKYTEFQGFCPFEIGDKVKIALDKTYKVFSNKTFVIGDILAIHSCKTGNIVFKILLDDPIFGTSDNLDSFDVWQVKIVKEQI